MAEGAKPGGTEKKKHDTGALPSVSYQGHAQERSGPISLDNMTVRTLLQVQAHICTGRWLLGL